jgi:hypothetical protein
MKLAILLLIVLAVVACIAGSLRKAFTVAAGYGAYIFLGQLYDYVLWPIVQGYHGMIGAVAMSLGAVAINFGVLHAYQRMGIDWLGIGVLQTYQTKAIHFSDRLLALTSWRGAIAHMPARLIRASVHLLRSRPLAFVVISSAGDSFLATAYLREGRFGPIERKDLGIFAASSVLSCAVWTACNAGFLSLIQSYWNPHS